MVSPILRINFDDKIFIPSSRFFTWKFEILFAISSGWPFVVIENIWTRFNHIKRSDLRIILTHAGSRISFIQADFLLIPPAIAIPSGHVSSSCFPRFILLPPASARARFALFSILVSVNEESRATDQKASGVDSTHTIDIATEVHGAATTNHQPPTTSTTCYHYLSAVQTGFLSFSATDSPPFSFIPPPCLAWPYPLTHLPDHFHR